MWCGVGMHDCTEIEEMTNIPGIKWLCGKCEPIFDKHFLPMLDQVAFFVGFKDEKNQAKKNKATVKQTDNNKDDGNESEEEEMEINNGDERNEKENVSEPEEPETNPTEKKECWHWRNRKCKFGDRCRDNHPELCKEILKWGKCTIENCTVIHSIVCKNMQK